MTNEIDYDKLCLVETKKGISFIIDLENWDKIKEYNWLVLDRGYVSAHRNNSPCALHRFILNPKSSDQLVDHINGNTLDNRKDKIYR